MTSDNASRSNCSARDASSLACSWIVPALPASSTICSISSLEMRASRNVVRSENGRSTTFELAVSSHTSGLAISESSTSGLAMISA